MKINLFKIKTVILVVLIIICFQRNSFSQDENTLNGFNMIFSLGCSSLYMTGISNIDGKSGNTSYEFKGIGIPWMGPFNLEVDISYKNFGFSFAQAITTLESRDLQLYYHGSKFCTYVYYITNKGYNIYIDNNDVKNYSSHSAGSNNDLRLTNFGFNSYLSTINNFDIGYYFFNSYEEVKPQDIFNWSILVYFSTSYFKIDNPNYLIPLEEQINFTNEKYLKDGEFINYSLLPGIAVSMGSIVSFSMAFFIGPSYQMQKYHVDTNETNYNNYCFLSKAHALMSISSKLDDTFSGINLKIDANYYETKEININQLAVKLRIFYGIKF